MTMDKHKNPKNVLHVVLVLICLIYLGVSNGCSKSKDVDTLIHQLDSDDLDIRKRAAKKLYRIGVPAVEKLINALDSGNQDLRVRAADILGKINDPRAVEPLIGLLKDQSKKVRLTAVIAIGSFKDTRFVQPLLEVTLRDDDSDVSARATGVLANYREDGFVESLVASLKDSSIKIRRNAACALWKFKDANTVEPLISALADSDPVVRDYAILTLGLIADPRAIESLNSILKNNDETIELQVSAAKSLGKIINVRAISPLIDAAFKENNHYLINVEALSSLKLHLILNQTATKSEIVSVLRDESPEVRKSAAWQLSKLGKPPFELIASAITRRDLAIVAGAYKFLIRRGGSDAESVLVDALYKYGSAEMAEDFVNCGNYRLRKAGELWARKNGYEIRRRFTSGLSRLN